MDKDTKRWIKTLSADIRSALNITQSVSNIKNYITILGGRIEYNIQYNTESAQLKKDGDTFIITICEEMSEERELFTIAHELGHLFIHMGYLIAPDFWNKQDEITYYRRDNNKFEHQANEFAAEFLMPEELFRLKMKENLKEDFYDMENVAREFNVSISSATLRAKFLNLVSW